MARRKAGPREGPSWKMALAVVAVVAAAGYFGWRWWAGGDEAVVAEIDDAATREAARAAEERLARFLRGEGEPELRLSETDITALLRYTYEHALPAGVSGVRALLRPGVVDIRLRSQPAEVPGLPGILSPVLGLVADTVGVEVEGALEILEGSRAMFTINRIGVTGVPLALPQRLVPPILEAVGRRSAPGLPPTSVVVSAPAAIGGVRVEDGALVLVRS